jgi:maleylacetoacetate isomerase
VKLYSYYRSSAAYRVRIGLNLKGLTYETVPIHLLRGRDGVPANRLPEYRVVNPQMRVPALETDDGAVLTQSLAILEWLDETFPEPALVPKDPILRAHVLAAAQLIACDVHPVHNSGVLARLRSDFGASEMQVNAWIARTMTDGFEALEALITPAPFAFGTTPSIADVCITPQLFGARRFGVPLDPYPKLVAVDQAMQALEPVRRAAPAAQPDAE